MRVWARLASRVETRAPVLDNLGRLSELSVIADREDRDAATLIIRHKREPPGSVHAQVARPVPARGALIEEPERARHRVEREGADGAMQLSIGPSDLDDGVQVAVFGVEREERGVDGPSRQSGRYQGTRPGVQSTDVDALPVAPHVERAVCVGAYVREDTRLVLVRHGAFRLHHDLTRLCLIKSTSMSIPSRGRSERWRYPVCLTCMKMDGTN